MRRINHESIILTGTLGLLALGITFKVSSSNQPIKPQPEDAMNEKIIGKVNGESIGLPTTLPKDLPFFPGSTIISSNGNKNSSQISLLSEGNLENLKSYYKESLIAKNWQTKEENKYYRLNEQLELSFVQDKENKTITIINYSLVPTK